MTTRSYGWIKSDKPARFAFAAHRAAAVPIADHWSLVASTPGVLDQGNTSACVGHAFAGAIATAYRAAGRPLPFVPSPMGIYVGARCMTRASGGSTGPLADDGSMPADAARFVSAFGVYPMVPLPGRYSDCEPATVNLEPNLSQLEAGARHLVVNEHGIASTGSARVDAVCRAIQASMPVTIGVNVDTAFEKWGPSQAPIGAPDPNDILGGHAVCIVGFDRRSGRTVFTVRNSWGLYTPDGNFLASEAWVDDAGAGDLMAIGGAS